MKAPAFQFYPSDWQRDMDDYPLEIEGAWIRICCRLYWSEGKSTKTLEEWSRILREKPRKTEQIFKFFSDKNICDLDNQNGSITITSRRMVRDAYIRKVRKESGILGGNPQLKTSKNDKVLLNQTDNQTVKQNPTPSSSSSSSSSIHKEINKEKKPRKLPLTDEQFFEVLKINKAYEGLDIDIQKAKCEAWCLANKRNFTRRTFVNWLNRAEKPIQTNTKNLSPEDLAQIEKIKRMM